MLPIALAGNIVLGDSTNADLFILALPLTMGHDMLALVAFVGGLSAATAMVIVASVALSIMISNDLIMPVVIRRTSGDASAYSADRSRLILMIRRLAIVLILLCAFAYYRAARHEIPLASIGLVSFAAIAQFAPALLGGMMWRRANAR
ncbi:MAG: histidine kinase, partial [Rhodocyclaceae bacterium]|nr:histidine kinase [Rhodocyclaceae bacterium]